MPEDNIQQDQSASTTSGTGQPGAQSQPQGGQPANGQAVTGQPQGGQQTPAEKQYTFREDRTKWIPPHRFGEVNTKLTAAQQRTQELERQVQALTGTRTPSADDAKAEELRSVLFSLVPQLQKFAGLSDEQLDQLLSTPQFVQQQQTESQQRWDSYREQQTDKVASIVADAIGVDSLSNEQREDLSETFRRWVFKKYQSELDTTGRSETATRYEKGDEKLLQEFADRYVKNWFEPARRAVTSRTLRDNPRVPASRGGQAATTQQKPDSFKSLDERLDYAVKVMKESGHEFLPEKGRRR
jgi:hypothetical protein